MFKNVAKIITIEIIKIALLLLFMVLHRLMTFMFTYLVVLYNNFCNALKKHSAFIYFLDPK